MKKIVEPILRDSYIAFIKNSVGSKAWTRFYAEIEGKRRDIVRGGNLSCAYFVTSVLKIFGLIDEIHLTTQGTQKHPNKNDLIHAGWKRVNKPKEGDIIVWEEMDFGREGVFPHIGFYLGGTWAVSTSTDKKSVSKHHFTYRDRRKIVAIYRHPKINK